MASIEINVNGKPYKVGCEDGQEERLRALAARFDKEVTALGGQVGQIGDVRLFLMAGLIICDELDEAERRAAAAPKTRAASAPRPSPDNGEAAAIIVRAAERIEALARKAETAS